MCFLVAEGPSEYTVICVLDSLSESKRGNLPAATLAYHLPGLPSPSELLRHTVGAQ